jgi:hypothetical protein
VREGKIVPIVQIGMVPDPDLPQGRCSPTWRATSERRISDRQQHGGARPTVRGAAGIPADRLAALRDAENAARSGVPQDAENKRRKWN